VKPCHVHDSCHYRTVDTATGKVTMDMAPGRKQPCAVASALPECCLLMSHRPHAIASGPRSSRRPGSGAVVWATGIAQLPGDQAVELLAWMAHALIAATLVGW
jgi:hypothetical protein